MSVNLLTSFHISTQQPTPPPTPDPTPAPTPSPTNPTAQPPTLSDLTASYDSAMGAPLCSTAALSCTTGPDLIKGTDANALKSMNPIPELQLQRLIQQC